MNRTNLRTFNEKLIKESQEIGKKKKWKLISDFKNMARQFF